VRRAILYAGAKIAKFGRGAMARRASARKAAAKSGATAKDRLVDAALTLAARQGWRRTGMAAIAAQAGLSLGEAYAAAPSKLVLLAAFHRRVDQAALAIAADGAEPARDRLFDVLMRRFDALAPHRPALRSILRDSLGDPAAVFGVPALLSSMGWMLEAAGISTAGLRGRLRSQLLTGLYLSVLRVFLDDDSTDLARTMALLDQRLRWGESWLGLGRSEPAEAVG
jgi:AcrR family transcriptional regulator